MAAEALGKVQTEFLDSLTREIGDNYENFMEGEFMLNEFVDRFGPRMAHLNGLLQVLSQLSATPNPAAHRIRREESRVFIFPVGNWSRRTAFPGRL